jgi:hypothetical protein
LKKWYGRCYHTDSDDSRAAIAGAARAS